MGYTCKPMADSFQCMTKSTTKIKKKNYNGKKKTTREHRGICVPFIFILPAYGSATSEYQQLVKFELIFLEYKLDLED